jgi:hypothetical protein
MPDTSGEERPAGAWRLARNLPVARRDFLEPRFAFTETPALLLHEIFKD